MKAFWYYLGHDFRMSDVQDENNFMTLKKQNGWLNRIVMQPGQLYVQMNAQKCNLSKLGKAV